MQGFYVYCIRPKFANALPAKAKGVDPVRGKTPAASCASLVRASNGVEFTNSIKVFPFKDIEAIVGELDPSKFDEEKVKSKLLNDHRWAEENIRRHHEVVDQAFQASVVIPMKFGTMYKTRKSLVKMFVEYYPKFKNLISRLQDKKEWGIKAHLDHKKCIEGLKKKNKGIQKLERRRSSVPEGMRWYTERKIDEIVSKEFEEEAEKEFQHLVEKLEKHSEKMLLNEVFSKDIQEPGREMIMNAACLVKNDALQSFRDFFHELTKDARHKGILLELTGPWPPYNFVEIKSNGKK